jgi:cbb3-type cytochrome oxidase subunit 3
MNNNFVPVPTVMEAMTGFLCSKAFLIYLIIFGVLFFIWLFSKKKRREETDLFRALMLENQNLRRRLGQTPNEEQDDMFSNNVLTSSDDNKKRQFKDIKWINAGLRHDIKILNIEDKETLLKAKALLLYLTTSEKQTPQFIEGVQKTLKVITILEKSVR